MSNMNDAMHIYLSRVRPYSSTVVGVYSTVILAPALSTAIYVTDCDA